MDIKSELLKNQAELLEKQSEELRNQKFNELAKENQRLKNNWNGLKEWVEGIGAKIACFGQPNTFYICSKDMLKKMEELEEK